MKNLIVKFMSAMTTKEINQIVTENIDFMMLFPESFKYAKNAKRRIHTIERQKKLSWKSYQLN